MARKGILSPGRTVTATRPDRTEKPRGAVGALQSSLSKLQENAVQEIDTALIDDAGVEDRLGQDHDAQKQLKHSLETYGQQVPVLVRPHPKTPGRFEIVYGRRRLQALRDLGQPVKAMVRQLDDHALVMAQGQENTARQDLSFIEKASFAAQLQDSGYERETIAAALSIDLPMLSRMLKVGTAFDLPFLRQIGSAPGIGRDRWMALVKLFGEKGARNRATALMNRPEFGPLTSDQRFDAVFQRAQPVAKPKEVSTKPRSLRSAQGIVLGDARLTKKGITLTVLSRGTDGFDQWIHDHAEDVIKQLHDQYQKDRSED